MTTLERKKKITELTKKISKLEQWALQYHKDKPKYNTFISRISSLKSLINLFERRSKDGTSIISKDYKKDVQEHSSNIEKYFEKLLPLLPFNWQQMEKECKEIEIDHKKHQSILRFVIKIKTEIATFHVALNRYNQSKIAQVNSKERYFVVATKKEVGDIKTKFNSIETHVLPYLKPIKSKNEVPNKNSVKKIHNNSTKLEVSLAQFKYVVNIKGAIQWDEDVEKKFIIEDIDKSPTFIIPQSTKKGRLHLNVTLTLKLNDELQKTSAKTENIYVNFYVEKGILKFFPLKNTTSTSYLPINDLLTEAVFNELKQTIKEAKKLKIEHPANKFNKWLKTQLKRQGISAKIIPKQENNSIVIKIMIETSDQTIDLSFSPLDVGISSNFIIKGDSIHSTIGSVDFKVAPPSSKIITQPKPTIIQFDKEGEFTLDSNDKLVLDNWFKSVEENLKKKFTAIEHKKNTSKDDISDIVDHLVTNILLGDQYSVTITGFTSSTESDKKNNKLGRKRALNIKEYLVKEMKLKASRIRTTTDGKDNCKSTHGDNSSVKDCRIGTIKFSLTLKNEK